MSVWYRLAPVAAALVAAGLVTVPAQASAAGSVEGVLYRIMADAATGEHTEITRVAVGDRLVTVPPDLVGNVPAGSRVALGLAPAAGAAGLGSPAPRVSSVRVLAAAPSATAVGTHHLTIVPMYWVGAAVPAGEPTTGELAAAGAAVDGYYDTSSAGRIRFTVDRVLPWRKITAPATDDEGCPSYDALESRARAAAGTTAHGSPHHLVAYFPQVAACGWAGLGTVGTGMSGDGMIWLNGYSTLQVFGHEAGHNLGLGHSNGVVCWSDDSRTSYVPLSDVCRTYGYFEPWDIMGNQATGELTAVHRDQLGILPAAAKTTINGTRALRLSPISSATGLREIIIAVGTRTYLLEYRTAAGLDSWTNDFPWGPGEGVVLRFRDSADPVWGAEESIVYLHPDQDSPGGRPGLGAGESWTAPGGAFRIDVGAADADGAGVTVTRTGDTTGPVVQGAPTLALRRAAVTANALPVSLDWSGVTDPSGVCGQRARLGGAALTAVSVAARRHPTTMRPGTRAAGTLVATDCWGNATTVTGPAGTARLDNRGTSAAGSWKTVPASGALGGSEQLTTARGAKVTYTVTARSVGVVATRGPGRGRVAVYVDGAKVTTVDLGRGTTALRQMIFTRTWASTGRHTVTLVGQGGKVGVDAFAALA